MSLLRPLPGTFRLDANLTVKQTIEAAAKAQRGRLRISVTDLVNPAQAYFQRTRPDIELPLERLQLMWTGTGFHNVFGAAVSSEEFLEQFVERDGVVGKIDIYEEWPVELKTSASLPEDLMAERGAYIEQLGMYCYMTTNPHGVVVVYRRQEYGRDAALRAYRVHFRDLDSVGRRMRGRRDLLIHALETSTSVGLGRCEWWQRKCLYQDVCTCGDEDVREPLVDPDSVEIAEDPQLTATLIQAANAWRTRPSWAISLNDLVFPRRGVLLRTVGRDEDEDGENLANMQSSGFFRTLTDAMRFGEPGAYAGQSVSLEGVRGVVRLHQGIPTIVRPTNTYQMIERDRLYDERPYWLDRLALEAALAGEPKGRLIVFYPRLPGGDKFMVYDYTFENLQPTLDEARRRIALFEAKAGVQEFPGCGPEWMPGYCPYKTNCACR